MAIAYDSFVSVFFRICYSMIAVICSHPSGYKSAQPTKAENYEYRLIGYGKVNTIGITNWLLVYKRQLVATTCQSYLVLSAEK